MNRVLIGIIIFTLGFAAVRTWAEPPACSVRGEIVYSGDATVLVYLVDGR